MRTWTDTHDGCPECGVTDITLMEAEVYGFEYEERYECQACGFEWSDVFRYVRSYTEEEA